MMIVVELMVTVVVVLVVVMIRGFWQHLILMAQCQEHRELSVPGSDAGAPLFC